MECKFVRCCDEIEEIESGQALPPSAGLMGQKSANREGGAMLHDAEDPKMVDIVNQARSQATQAATDETPLLESSGADVKKRVSFLPFLK